MYEIDKTHELMLFIKQRPHLHHTWQTQLRNHLESW